MSRLLPRFSQRVRRLQKGLGFRVSSLGNFLRFRGLGVRV